MKKKSRILIYSLSILGLLLTFTISCKKDEIKSKSDPVITWANPANISYGTLLSETQLNATADVSGTFIYTPPIESKLNVGANQELKVDFTPNDFENYNSAIKTVKINVTNNPIFNPNLTYGRMYDMDGNEYKTITIGTQTWMAENLRTTHYRNGDAIPKVTDPAEWTNLSTGAYCNYNNTNNIDTITTYGRLYNGYAVFDSRNIAPAGWHVATGIEWTTLTNLLGGDDVAGGKLKETGTTHWDNPNIGATNESGFTALPGGYRHWYEGSTPNIGYFGYWWTSSEAHENLAWYRCLMHHDDYIYKDYGYKRTGSSVRCIKD